MRICVYGAASPTIDPEYIRQTEIMGEEMAKRGHSLVFGGGANGLMGAAARGVKKGNGYILGVIPSFFDEEKIENVKISISAEDISEAKKPTPMKKLEKPAPKKVEKKPEEKDMVEEFTGSQKDEQVMSKYSFDIRT